MHHVLNLASLHKMVTILFKSCCHSPLKHLSIPSVTSSLSHLPHNNVNTITHNNTDSNINTSCANPPHHTMAHLSVVAVAALCLLAVASAFAPHPHHALRAAMRQQQGASAESAPIREKPSFYQLFKNSQTMDRQTLRAHRRRKMSVDHAARMELKHARRNGETKEEAVQKIIDELNKQKTPIF